ncbi:SCP2 sterol-binding domain-containing protein [Streptomyces sp. NPDC088725]|uniref:SCP2 sterol-binding domain-containing protein n=1 Tax=Streptomyces sp. NPDC088725 TaxID=3365873 RepID=UPI00380B06F5
MVKGLSGRELAEALRGELRQRVLREIFGRMREQFRPENAGTLSAVIRWRITGESDAVFETVIDNGHCTVREGPGEDRPRTTFVLRDVDFLRLASGNAGPVTMYLTRKVRITGDLSVAAGLPRYFEIPKA